MNFQIEKGVRIPPRGQFQPKYPFHTMDIGDSFRVGVEDKERVRKAANQHALRNGVRFTIRSNCEGAQVWRIG